MKAVMYGAGNIGRGFIGQLFNQSGYEVVFIDVNKELINTLNERKCYTVEVMENDYNEEIKIDNVRGVDGMDIDAVTREIAEADLMATAVGVNILPRIAGNIAAGLQKRWNSGNKDILNIILCENLIDADKFLAAKIKENLNEEEIKKFESQVGLVEASIGRMVPIQTPEMTKNDILRVCVEKYCNLIVDKNGFKGKIPEVKNMSAYPTFQLYIERKLFIHNFGHAMTAYLGNLKGCEFIWQAITDPEIELMVLRGMTASAMALSKKYDVPFKDLYEHVEDLLNRFTNRKLGDTVFRVGRDLKRKLSPSDRVMGSIRTCREQGINPTYIYAATAAALQFKLDETANNSAESILNEISELNKNDEAYKTIMEFNDLILKGGKISDLAKKAKCLYNN